MIDVHVSSQIRVARPRVALWHCWRAVCCSLLRSALSLLLHCLASISVGSGASFASVSLYFKSVLFSFVCMWFIILFCCCCCLLQVLYRYWFRCLFLFTSGLYILICMHVFVYFSLCTQACVNCSTYFRFVFTALCECFCLIQVREHRFVCMWCRHYPEVKQTKTGFVKATNRQLSTPWPNQILQKENCRKDRDSNNSNNNSNNINSM